MKQWLLISLLVALCAPRLEADIIERVLVKVNGAIFTQTDLENRQVARLRERNPLVSAEDLRNDAELRKVLAEITPQLLVGAVDELLILQRGRDLGYSLGDEQFRDIVANIRKENEIDTDEQFQAALQQEGMTLADLREVVERQMLVSQVQQIEVLNKISITEVEQTQYYDEHVEEFIVPAAVTLREILIGAPMPQQGGASQPLADAVAAEARKKAEAVRARLMAGEDFARVAAEVSDAPSKANGGLIGPVNRDELASIVTQLLEGLQVGEVSEVARTQQGFQILKLESATEAAPRPFEEVRQQVADKVFEERRIGEYTKFLDKLREAAIIEWKSDTLQQQYDQHLASVGRGTSGP